LAYPLSRRTATVYSTYTATAPRAGWLYRTEKCILNAGTDSINLAPFPQLWQRQPSAEKPSPVRPLVIRLRSQLWSLKRT